MTTENKTLKDVTKCAREFLTAQITNLNGLLEKLPEAAKAEYQALRDKFNVQLAGLEPLEQVPAAMEASYGFNYLGNMINRISEVTTGMMNNLRDMQPKLVSLNSFETRMAKKELIEKTELDELVKLAREDERKKTEDTLRPQILAMRKSAVQLAGLPDASDDILGLTAEDFEKRLTGAKANIDLAKTKNLDPKMKLISLNVWKSAEDFKGHVDHIVEVAGPGRNRSHPLMGGGGGEERGEDKGNARFVC